MIPGWLKIGLFILLILILVFMFAVYLIVPGMVEKAQNKVRNHSPYDISESAAQRHAQLRIADWHSDSLLWNRNLLKRSNYGHMDIPRLREGNVAVQMFTVVTKSPSGQNYQSNESNTTDNITYLAVIQRWPIAAWKSLYERARHQADRLHGFAEQVPEEFSVVLNKSDLERGLKQRALAIQSGNTKPVMGLLGLEGCHALEGELGNVRGLYEAGFRMVGLHHFFDNLLGGSLHGITHEGLTEFGRDVVRELERLEIIIDLSHSSEKVVEDVLEIAKRPVVLSHTGVYRACKSPRNIRDGLMQKIAAKGGLIGIGYWAGAVCDIRPKGIVNALRQAIDLVGVDHVALGSDFDGSTTTELDTSELAILTQTMIHEGFSEEEISKVMGENTIRFLLKYLPQ